MNRDSNRLAVLIDAENAQLAILAALLAEVAKVGSATVKRVYGDFTTPALAHWREALLASSILPVQQFRNTVHKNASDSALIIDAMDLLHSGRFDGFCIVSSDSDFTRLASRIREEGLLVFGFGEKQTPRSFVAACDRFIYTEIFRKPANENSEAVESHEQVGQQNPPADLNELMAKMKSAVESCEDDSGWALLSKVGKLLSNHQPDFDPRHYGFKNLSSLVTSMEQLETERRTEANVQEYFVRIKR